MSADEPGFVLIGAGPSGGGDVLLAGAGLGCLAERGSRGVMVALPDSGMIEHQSVMRRGRTFRPTWRGWA